MSLPHAAEDHAARRIVETDRVIVPLVHLLGSKLLRSRYALACKPMDEFTTVCPYVLPRRVVPGSNIVKRRVKTRFGVRLNIAFIEISQHGIQVLIGLGFGIKLHPRLHIGISCGWIVLAQMKYMTCPIGSGRHERVTERRLGSIAAAC